MGIEEQKQERESLGYIFPEEITDISDNAYQIAITLDVESHNEDKEPPILILQVTYSENYPDEAPYLDISAPSKESKHEFLDVQEDKHKLLEALQPTIDENLGMEMVYQLTDTLKDSAELLINERRKAAIVQRETEIRKAEEEENKKFHGNLVTRETFLAWMAKFKQEQEDEEQRLKEEKEAEDKRRKIKEEKRLTGKELWMSGLATNEEEEEALEDIPQTMEELKISS